MSRRKYWKIHNYSVPIEKEVKKIEKNGEKLKDQNKTKIDSARFMVSSLPNLANNLVEGIHKIKCKYGLDNKKCGTFGTKYKDCEWCLGYTSLKMI